MKHSLYNLFLLGFIASFLWSCNSAAPQKPSQTGKPAGSSPVVEGFLVKPTTVIEKITVSGTLKPFEETVLMTEVGGRVVQINLSEGNFVKQGTILVKLFDEDLQAELKKAEAQLQLAEQTQKRQNELLKINGISQNDYDQSLLLVNSINADIEVLKAQIRKTEVRAPFDGIIGLRNISLGAQITPQTPLATIRILQQLKLDFSVPEKYSSQIKPGLKVVFSVDGDTTLHEATVLATEGGIESATRNLKTRAIVKNKATTLRPGAFANVLLELGKHDNALMVPTQAIIPSDRNKQLIVSKNGKATFVPVSTGVRQASLIEILSGIMSGDTIVTTGLLFLKPGADLKFSKVAL
jgi:membrane fusion protein (multidrug efflux system)